MSLVMMAIAMTGLKNMTPWVDEVMFADTPMHYAKGLGWTTHAWYSAARQDPFLLYPPLYSMLMALWMKLVGTTLTACRSLNLIVTMSIGWGLLRLCRQLGVKLPPPQVGLLVLLLWCTDDMIFMYRNGRPDLLGASILLAVASETLCYVKTGRHGWRLVLLSALLIASAVQAAVCLSALLLLACITLRDHRDDIRRISALSASGLLLGFLSVCVFMACHGHLTSFVVNALSYSSTLMKLAMAVLPVWGDCTGTDTTLYLEKIALNTTDVPLYSRILTVYTRPAYAALLGATLWVAVSERRQLKRSSLHTTTMFLSAFVWSIPVCMNLAGRFPPYYYWMVYLPAFLLMLVLAGQAKKRSSHCAVWLAVLLLAVRGLLCASERSNYPAAAAFMEKCGMLTGKNIVAPFSVFYEAEKLSSNTYYLGVYPTHCLPETIDYVILPQRESEYGASRLYDYYDRISKSDTLQTVLVAESKTAGLKVFSICHRPRSRLHQSAMLYQ